MCYSCCTTRRVNSEDACSLNAFAALRLGIHGGVTSYHRAVWRVLLDDEAHGGSGELRTLVLIGDGHVHGNGRPFGGGAGQLGFVPCHDFKFHVGALLVI